MAATTAKKSTSKKGSAKKTAPKKTAAKKTAPKRVAAKRAAPKKAAPKKSTRAPKTERSADRADKSVEAFRDALERSVTLPRERIQEVVDDAVKRGRMTRDDANELVSKLVSRGRKQSEEMVKDLEALLEEARKQVEKGTTKARKQAKGTAAKLSRSARDAADEPLASVDKARRKAGIGSDFPITGYDELTAAQIGHRLNDLSKPELRKVRTHEKNGQGSQEHPGRRSRRRSAERPPRRGDGRNAGPSWTCGSTPSPRVGGESRAPTRGFVIFVGGGLPGDRVRVRVGKSKRSWAEAAIVDLLESAPERIPDRCVHGGEPCPGAAWQGLPYELQLSHKQAQVSEALVRLGGFEGDQAVDVEPIVRSRRAMAVSQQARVLLRIGACARRRSGTWISRAGALGSGRGRR